MPGSCSRSIRIACGLLLRRSSGNGEARPQFRTDGCGFSGGGVDGAPDGARAGENAAIVGAPDFGMAVEAQARAGSHPGEGGEAVFEVRGVKVVDLVAEHDPEQARLFGGRRGGGPVGYGGILHPA